MEKGSEIEKNKRKGDGRSEDDGYKEKENEMSKETEEKAALLNKGTIFYAKGLILSQGRPAMFKMQEVLTSSFLFLSSSTIYPSIHLPE